MPHEETSDNTEEKPNGNPFVERTAPRGGNQPPPPHPNNPATPDDQNNPNQLEKIKKGEYWLIGVGVASVLVNLLIAWSYWQQLNQMRISTEASTEAARAASEGIDVSMLNMDRQMQQIVNQTAAEIKAADAAKGAANAAKRSAENAAAIQRPWIRMSLELSRFTQIAQGYDLTTIPTLKNVGSGVASDVNYRIEFRVPHIPAVGEPQKVNAFTVAWAVKDWCKNVKPAVNDLGILFPGDIRQQPQHTLNVLYSDMGKSGFRLNGEERYQLLVYGCVLYRFKPFPTWHHAAIVYELSAFQGGMPYLLKPRQIYQLPDLNFSPFPFSPEWGD